MQLFYCDYSSVAGLPSCEVGKSVVTAVTDCPDLFDFILQDFRSNQPDVQITAVQMMTACLNSDTLTRYVRALRTTNLYLLNAIMHHE